MPFECKGAERLDEKIAVRLTATEKEQLKEDADVAGLSVSELVRRRYFGRKISASTDQIMIRELRRLGGLLKHIHVESDGKYSKETAAVLGEIQNYLRSLKK